MTQMTSLPILVSHLLTEKVPRYDAEDYTRLINWSKTKITEPLLTKQISDDDLKKMIKNVPKEIDILKFPCHIQAVETNQTCNRSIGQQCPAPRLAIAKSTVVLGKSFFLFGGECVSGVQVGYFNPKYFYGNNGGTMNKLVRGEPWCDAGIRGLRVDGAHDDDDGETTLSWRWKLVLRLWRNIMAQIGGDQISALQKKTG
ncbi:hypothetical protein ILUMI_12031 [Ignelater luminosus]|uniref:Uncharacterized protein n=1 Tax=Ignelater luminosus TaxID=2038154 RepID=A0A8K0CV37_IGNLU|nr:hypothetical protein ILUMI_12031 [Ignelater luminosus]